MTMQTQEITLSKANLTQIFLGFVTENKTADENADLKRQAVDRLVAKMGANAEELQNTLQLATYVNDRDQSVISASDVYDLLWDDEFSALINGDSNTPEEWQFARMVLGGWHKKIVRENVNLKTKAERKAWIQTISQVLGIGERIDTPPATGGTWGELTLSEGLNKLIAEFNRAS